MAAPSTKHYKFPKTPHLPGSAVVDDDETASSECLRVLAKAHKPSQSRAPVKSTKSATVSRGTDSLKPSSSSSSSSPLRLIIDEKMDGANVSVHFEQEWVPLLQKRSGLIGTSGEHTQVRSLFFVLEPCSFDEILLFRTYVSRTTERAHASFQTDSPLWCERVSLTR
mmetsp:Transcript_31241/g.78403  ORF Transcript_31241/g.78403 Transcript_31241/m.78403 type:complete len:167 (-) Transcript_31241:60-560(-)